MNHGQDDFARAAALVTLKTFIVRDLGLINELADQRAVDITSTVQASGTEKGRFPTMAIPPSPAAQ